MPQKGVSVYRNCGQINDTISKPCDRDCFVVHRKELHMTETLGGRIKRLRKSKDKTQEQVASALLLNRRAIGSYERNEREPNLETIVLLARYFHVTTDYLLGVGKIRTINANGLTEKEYLLIKEIVSVMIDKNRK